MSNIFHIQLHVFILRDALEKKYPIILLCFNMVEVKEILIFLVLFNEILQNVDEGEHGDDNEK